MKLLLEPNIEFDLECFADMEETELRWIWPGVIPRGMPSLIAGKQGLGKSYLICDLAARLSAGMPLPDGTIHPPAKVLLMAREDDPGCVLKPRLVAAGADCRRVAWSIFQNVETKRMMDLTTNTHPSPIMGTTMPIPQRYRYRSLCAPFRAQRVGNGNADGEPDSTTGRPRRRDPARQPG